jgi:hypothetical protein
MAIGKHIALGLALGGLALGGLALGGLALGGLALGGLAMLLTAAAPAASAQEPEPQLTKDDEFWFSTPRRRAATAVQLVGARDPLTVAVMRSKTLREQVWGEMEFVGDFAPKLSADYLDLIRDHRPMPDVRGIPDEEIPRADRAMINAYNEALIYAFRHPLDAFKKSAKDHEHLKFAHLWNQPDLHRGKVITVTGRLARVRKYEAPSAAQEAGVKYLYEGWLFGETKGSHPFAIVFAVLPEGLPIAEKMDRGVTFYGYFLTRYKYRAQKGDVETPLLIGPTVVLSTPAAASDDITPFPVFALIGVGIVLTGIVTGMFIISWWFRRGDSKIQSQLADLHHRRVRDMMEESPQWRDEKP